jgi:hypothetical protein
VTASTKAVGGWVDGMANKGESPQPPSVGNRPKVLGLNQKVGNREQGSSHALPQTEGLPAERRGLTHRGAYVERGKPAALPEGKASRKASSWGCG